MDVLRAPDGGASLRTVNQRTVDPIGLVWK
jgi:hypothetical protein